MDREAEAATRNMVSADDHAYLDSNPQSPAASELSNRSNEEPRDLELRDLIKNLPSKTDLAAMINKLEASFHAKMEAVNSDLQQIKHRVTDLEEEKDVQQSQMLHFSSVMDSHMHFMTDIQRQLDDLDNRGRRNNLRVRGLPELQGEDLTSTLTDLFNLILGLDPGNKIILDRAHRSLKPRGPAAEMPRDVICRLHYYTEKESILRALRDTNPPSCTGAMLYRFSQTYPGSLCRLRTAHEKHHTAEEEKNRSATHLSTEDAETREAKESGVKGSFCLHYRPMPFHTSFPLLSSLLPTNSWTYQLIYLATTRNPGQ
ncbi:Hypothetical predicted protein [Pelobates cultripes]|uniref:Uncharacterized protein n=1 Tax=Pelobates cultripes TaxID=61616 RepID=A0AAD1TIB2_PELCU|nr:Hypothetical predicted protein [Pelobates cultripes]